MEKPNFKVIRFKTKANTNDIVEGIMLAAKYWKYNFSTDGTSIPEKTGNIFKDSINICKFIHQNIRYEEDGLENQNIVFPNNLLVTKKGDCKSFSILFYSIMNYFGYDVGFVLASYSQDGNFTHIYNYLFYNNNFYTFDTCVSDFKESKKYTNIKYMNVNFVSKPDTYISGIESREGRKKRRQLRKEGGRGFRVKKIALAVPRNAFIGLVGVNFRGLATSLAKLKESNDPEFRKFWLKLGGDPAKLYGAAKKARDKKPLFGRKRTINGYVEDTEWINGIGVAGEEVVALIAAATPIILGAMKLIAANGGKNLELESFPSDYPESNGMDLDSSGEGFEALDPELPPGPSNGFSFNLQSLFDTPTKKVVAAISVIGLIYIFVGNKNSKSK